jgi:hypothetical protein
MCALFDVILSCPYSLMQKMNGKDLDALIINKSEQEAVGSDISYESTPTETTSLPVLERVSRERLKCEETKIDRDAFQSLCQV